MTFHFLKGNSKGIEGRHLENSVARATQTRPIDMIVGWGKLLRDLKAFVPRGKTVLFDNRVFPTTFHLKVVQAMVNVAVAR